MTTLLWFLLAGATLPAIIGIVVNVRDNARTKNTCIICDTYIKSKNIPTHKQHCLTPPSATTHNH